MNRRFVVLLMALSCIGQNTPCVCKAQNRPRLLVLSDFYKDPDDKQSMIRLLSYANEFDIEGLIATSLAYGDGAVHPEWILDQIDDYAAVYPTLSQHGRRDFLFPTPDELRNVVRSGAAVRRKFAGAGKGFAVPFPPGTRDARSCAPADQWIGAERDTDASRHIIRVVDRHDSRPVWISVWGGAMDLAQALWRVRNDRTPDQVCEFVQRLRVYQISWQDTGAVWIWNNFPDLFLIQNRQALRGIYAEGDPNFRNENWVWKNITQSHGALAAGYPRANIKGIKEGDTPSFLYLLAPGLTDPEHPDWGGWGGRFERLDQAHRFFVDAQDTHPATQDTNRRMRWTVGRWNRETSNAFAARMDWCVNDYAHANHAPIAVVDGDSTHEVLFRQLTTGTQLQLSAAGSMDPDDDELSFHWWQYTEAGSRNCSVTIRNADSVNASVQVADTRNSGSAHIVLSVSDTGQPSLTAHRRIILQIPPSR